MRNSIPSLAWYFKTLSIEPKSFDRFTELARLELHDRTVHGDGVNADNYVKCYGIGVSPLDPSTKICVRPTGRTSTVCPVFGLAGEVVVGRQRRGESAPFSLQPLDDIQKLVVGDRSESRISRRQLELRLLTPDFLAVINTSEIASVEYDQGALAPGAAITLPVPCSLRLASCMLDFNRVHRS